MTLSNYLTRGTFAVLLGCTSAAALASDRPQTEGVVRYTEAQLGSLDGARRVYRRITSTAESVCAAQDGASLDRKQRFAACRSTAIERAVARLDAPMVTALHEGRTGAAVAWVTR